MTPKLIDAHAHLNFNAFKDDADEVIRRALDAGVWMINIGTSRDTSERAVEIASRYNEGVYAIIGLHPIHAGEDFDYEYYKTLARSEKVVGIGETGLDYFRIKNQELGIKERQKNIFQQHIKLAQELDTPLMLHVRGARPNDAVGQAYDDVLKMLPAWRGNAHFFAGTWEQAKRFLDLGFTLSFTGVITFAREYDDVVQKTPLNKILIETDAPFVAPAPHRGGRCEPLYVEHVARRIAEIKRESYEKVAEITTANARRAFGIL